MARRPCDTTFADLLMLSPSYARVAEFAEAVAIGWRAEMLTAIELGEEERAGYAARCVTHFTKLANWQNQELNDDDRTA